MGNVFNTDTFFSAVKRKAIGEILATAFGQAGYEEAAEIAKNTTRITDAAITRMRDAMSKPVEEQSSKCPVDDDEFEDETKPATEEVNTVALMVSEIKGLVATGKKKNIKIAKKAFKDQFSKDHPQYKELKKLFKKDK